MDTATYTWLFGIIQPLIIKSDTVMRQAIPPADRLSLTLRYLATGKHKIKLLLTSIEKYIIAYDLWLWHFFVFITTLLHFEFWSYFFMHTNVCRLYILNCKRSHSVIRKKIIEEIKITNSIDKNSGN